MILFLARGRAGCLEERCYVLARVRVDLLAECTLVGEFSAFLIRSASAAGRLASSFGISVEPAASVRSAGERTPIWNSDSSTVTLPPLRAQQVHEPVEVGAVVEVEAVRPLVQEHVLADWFVSWGSAQNALSRSE